MMKPYKIGYTQGTYDMFHVGHLNLINHAKEYCDYLIVGVNSDSLVQTYKHKTPVISEIERQEIVSNIKAVDRCIIATTLDKIVAWKELHFDAIFIGDDWKGNTRWEQTEKDLEPFGASVVYLPHTDGVSSTILRPLEGRRVVDSDE
ncbi:MAG: adenylyltransferase/cytidyltransferase family protein [Bacteroides thetaiotaomicron]|nr:adenylyltransferase/cytidyltransferase family protein [Bacteroides thetaiotaomicron]